MKFAYGNAQLRSKKSESVQTLLICLTPRASHQSQADVFHIFSFQQKLERIQLFGVFLLRTNYQPDRLTSH